MLTREAVLAALATVQDPEIHRPITELEMVGEIRIDGASVGVEVLLTIAGCPMRGTITTRVEEAVGRLEGVTDVAVKLTPMTDEQRTALKTKLQGSAKEIPFNLPGNRTLIYAIASGKGGVGKSSVTANLAAAMAAQGLTVGVLDADIYGHSIPGILGATAAPNWVEGMIMPVEGHGVRVMSMGPLKPGGIYEPVVWRGPRLHRVLEQLMTDVWWGELDVLLLDLPPGTGDVAMSIGQLLPKAELIIVTTPQQAAAEVAIRAGMVALYTNQKIAGVIENMSAFGCPHCGEPIAMFGTGGGEFVAQVLGEAFNTKIPLLGRIPFDPALRVGGDDGLPLVVSAPTSGAATSLTEIAEQLSRKPRGLAGLQLNLTPAGR
ncbi:MAG: P-loop NTPase [Candidatus Nanopelagicales bacterium]